jgi:hypothetical protein
LRVMRVVPNLKPVAMAKCSVPKCENEVVAEVRLADDNGRMTDRLDPESPFLCAIHVLAKTDLKKDQLYHWLPKVL